MDLCLHCDCRLLLNKIKETILHYVVSLSTQILAIKYIVKSDNLLHVLAFHI